MYDAIIANTTASASGTNRKRATPDRKNIGTKTMQMHSVETNAGTPISPRADDDRLLERLAEVQVALDVLDRHDRLVDEDADREREAAERHQVERLAEHLQDQDRGQDRERNRQRDDQRRAPVAEEEQDHHRGQAGGDQRLDDDALRSPP